MIPHQEKSDQKKRAPTRKFLRYIEEQAMLVRQRAELGPLDRLDPQTLAQIFRIEFIDLREIPGISREDGAHLERLDASVWSGMSDELPDGRLMIVLNPNQTPERANVTMVEEAMHVHYGHERSRLVVRPDGGEERKYNERAEQEAYWTAAAALLPAKVVAQFVWRGKSAESLARRYGTSVELAEMRIRLLGLWSHYKAAQGCEGAEA